MSDTVKLRVVEGPRPGQTFEVRLGRRVIVGRSRDATVRIESPALSREHFELSWDGATCRLRDLGSRNGVRVNGRLVGETVLHAGDEIRIAELLLQLGISAARRRIVEESTETPTVTPTATPTPAPASAPTPAPAPAPAPADEVETQAEEEQTVVVPLSVYDHVSPTLPAEKPQIVDGSLLASLARACTTEALGRTYALIDGAQAFELAFTARLMGNRIYTLFSGALAVDLAHVGPCLIELSKVEAFLEKWLAALGTHAGVLLQTRADLPTLYAHLRGLFVATDEGHQEYFFRFYDPRVLRVFLPTCRPDELSQFFGPVDLWIAEDEAHSGYLYYSAAGGVLRQSGIAGV